jgi:hypothetical protein
MGNNKYLTDFDRKIDAVIKQHEEGRISAKVLKIALGILLSRHYADKLSGSVNRNCEDRKMIGINLKKITEYYNEAI